MDTETINEQVDSKEINKFRNINHECIFQFPFLIEQYRKYAKFTTANQIDTGFLTLDNMIRGIKPGEVCYIVSQTNIGKTAIAMNIIRNNVSDNFVIPFFSLENNQYQLFERMLQLEYNLASWDIEKNFADDLTSFIDKSEKDLMKYKNIINVVRRIALEDFLPYTSYIKAMTEKPIGLVVIDYAQLIKTNNQNEYIRTSEIAQNLKELSLSLKIPVLALSQTSRINSKDEKGLDIYSAKGSGEIENSAQILLTLEKVKTVSPDEIKSGFSERHNDNELDILKLTIHKKKRGEFGYCFLAMHKPSLFMEDITVKKQ